MSEDAVATANAHLRELGYAERDLAVHAGPRGKALLKGNKILSPFSDDAALVRLGQDIDALEAEVRTQ